MLRPKLNRIWAKDSDALRRDPGDAKYLQGWISEIPTFQVLNFLQYKVDTTLLSIAERGIPEWGSDIQYGIGRVVWDDEDDSIYIAIVQKPDKLKRPSANLAHWSKSSIQITKKEFDDIVKTITNHIADKNNPHKVSAAQLNAYDKGEMDALVAQYRALVQAHVDDRNNPHGTTAEDVDAVSKSRGGVYAADVTFLQPIIMNADNTARVCQSNGLYLEVGPKEDTVAVVGLNAEGIAVAGPKNAKSPIVTEPMFQDLKARFSPDYAVPTPSWQANLMNNFNVQVGASGVESNVDVLFDAQTGAAIRQVTDQPLFNTDVGIVDVANPFEMSFAVDIFVDSNNNIPVFGTILGMLNTYLAIRNDGIGHHIGFPGISSASFDMAVVNKWIRLCYTVKWVDGVATHAGYVDGVLKVEASGPAEAPNSGDGRAFIKANQSDTGSFTLTRNWRVWNQYLTPKQVSTL